MVLIAIVAVTAIVVGGLTHAVTVGIVLGVILAGGYYLHDVRRNPKVACRRCGGSGDNLSRLGGGWLFRRPRGPCGHCGGKKGVPRPALRFIDNAERKKIRDAIRTAKKAIRR